MRREIITTLLLFCSVAGFCQLQFNTDTLYSESKDSGKTFTPVIGQVWFLQNSIVDDTVIFTRDEIKRGPDRYQFSENGELEIDFCFVECGKYICGFLGTWKENDNAKLNICFYDEVYEENYNLFFFYRYSDDNRKLTLCRISN